MLRCPACARLVPEVRGTPTQACPHCGHEFPSPSLEGAPGAQPGVDPAGAAAAAFAFARRHYGAILLVWLPALVADVAAVVGVAAYERAAGLALDVQAMTDAQRLQWLGVAAPVFLATVVVKLALFAVVGALVLQKERVEGARTAVRDVLRQPLVLAALGLVLVFAYLVGILLAGVGFLVLFHWFQHAPVALAHRRQGLGDAFEASRRFARDRRAYGFTALVLLVALAAFVVDQALEWAAAFVLSAAGLGSPLVGGVVGAVVLWLVAPIVAVLPASYWALAARAGPPAPRPPVEAAPAPSSRTTKCPQCATLIPYAPTGAPVDVTCPSCGRKGRVI